MSSKLHIEPRSWFSKVIDIREQSRVVATLELSMFSDQGTATIGTEPYQLKAQSFFARWYKLISSSGEVLQSETSGWFCRTHRFAYDNEIYRIHRRKWWGHENVLLDAHDRELATMAPDGWLTRQATAQFKTDLPLHVRIFVIWVIYATWRQRRRRS